MMWVVDSELNDRSRTKCEQYPQLRPNAVSIEDIFPYNWMIFRPALSYIVRVWQETQPCDHFLWICARSDGGRKFGKNEWLMIVEKFNHS